MYKNDRRMFDRFEVDFSAEIKYPKSNKSDFAQCCDVSACGLGLYTEEKLVPKKDLEVWLGIPDGHLPFRGLAWVIWTKQVQESKWRSGLEFKNVDFMGTRRVLEMVGAKAQTLLDKFPLTA